MENKEHFDIAVSIGTVDRFDLLSDCTDAILENRDGLSVKVIIIDNGSSDPDNALKIRRRYPEAEVQVFPETLGFCRPHNLGLQATRSRYHLIVDNDVLVLPGTLKAMVEFMDTHPDVGLAGCRHVFADRSFQKSFHLQHNLKTELLQGLGIQSFWPDTLFRNLDAPREVEVIMSSFWLARREMIDSVGGLDEDYVTIMCEADWCHRIRKQGWKIMYLPEVEIVHLGGDYVPESRLTFRPGKMVLFWYKNRFLFFHKHFSRFSEFLLRLIFLMAGVLRLAKYGGLYLLKPRHRQEIKPILSAFCEVLKLAVSPFPYEYPISKVDS